MENTKCTTGAARWMEPRRFLLPAVAMPESIAGMKGYKAFTPEQRRSWWIGLIGPFLFLCLGAWSLLTHRHIHHWTSLGLMALAVVCMGFFTWTRYNDPNTPYK